MSDIDRRTKLEQLLNKVELEWGDDQEIEILPNGEISAKGESASEDLGKFGKPLTFRENLGGEYAGS